MRSTTMIRRFKRKGLTLIELVVVVAILAILAGFIVPRLGFVRNLAAESGNATIIADSATQAVFYNTAVGHYPQGEDTLLTSTGVVYPKLNASLLGAITPLDLSTDASAGKSIVAQLDPSGLSVTLYGGTTVAGSATPNSDFTTVQTLTYDPVGKAATGIVAQITPPVAADATAKNPNWQIYQAAYGAAKLDANGAPLDKTFLVALGYGQNSEINGKTGLEAPVLFDKVAGEYTRPVLLLKVFGKNSDPNLTHVPIGTSAATSISIGFDASTAGAQLAKYAVDQNR